ncbi:hypothetical protein [Acinetobacter baumannii]|uniref:hypothetical protein n=1 Tax=Acinetobacter baumannii TaxID=470 RepID=UPI002448657E|nr:hypothetical protein [Acinetobacter baumannii]MDH2626643.1 hypothetical protein [Acinetobacter baumannii]
MNTNVIFAWPVLTTVFTTFLYWSGYWYYVGYTEFYNYKISVFDLPLSVILIEGLAQNVHHVLTLLSILIVISFINSVNKEQWRYVSGAFIAITLSVIMFFIYIFRQFFNSLGPFPLLIDLKNKIKKFFHYIKTKLRKPTRFLLLAARRVQRFQRKNKLTELDIRNSSFTSTNPPAHSFIFAVYLHYFLLLFLVVGVYLIFKAAAANGTIGQKQAEKDFNNFNKMAKVSLNSSFMDEGFRNTGVCFKGYCLITDKYKNVQSYEMKTVKVVNKVPEDKIKKAP